MCDSLYWFLDEIVGVVTGVELTLELRLPVASREVTEGDALLVFLCELGLLSRDVPRRLERNSQTLPASFVYIDSSLRYKSPLFLRAKY